MKHSATSGRRISWDRVNNMLAALPGTRHLATTSGGTIADRGYFGVYLEDGRTRVGEVDEEFVYESRTGDTFLLGSSVWRVMDIDANRIIVTPAPGQPARMPFWRGEGIGRSFELGSAIGAFRRELDAPIRDTRCPHLAPERIPRRSARRMERPRICATTEGSNRLPADGSTADHRIVPR